MAALSLGDFYGIDSVIDFLVAVTAVLIYYQSNRAYRLLKEKRYQYFSWSFFLIAIAYLLKIGANLTALHTVIINSPNFVPLIIQFREMQLIHFLSYTAHKFFLLAGVLTLFLITKKNVKKEDPGLLIYLSVIAVLFSVYFNFVYHLTLVIILTYLASYFYENYRNNQTKNAQLVFFAFLFLWISHFIDMFSGLHLAIYLIGEIFVFLAFIFLFINHLRTAHGKEKNQTGSDKRSSRSPAKR